MAISSAFLQEPRAQAGEVAQGEQPGVGEPPTEMTAPGGGRWRDHRKLLSRGSFFMAS